MARDKKDTVLESLKNTISKDPSRIFLTGVYHCGERKRAISTNGYALTASSKLYEEDLAGKILNPKDFGLIKKEYLKVGPVMDVDYSSMKLGQWSIDRKYLKFDCPLYFYIKDGKYLIGVDEREDFEFVVRQDYLKAICDNVVRTVQYREKLSPVHFDLSGNGSFGELLIVMPYKVGEKVVY